MVSGTCNAMTINGSEIPDSVFWTETSNGLIFWISRKSIKFQIGKTSKFQIIRGPFDPPSSKPFEFQKFQIIRGPFEVDLEFGQIHQIPDKTPRSGIWSKTNKKQHLSKFQIGFVEVRSGICSSGISAMNHSYVTWPCESRPCSVDSLAEWWSDAALGYRLLLKYFCYITAFIIPGIN